MSPATARQPLRLYASRFSGHAHRAKLFLSLLGLSFQTIEVEMRVRDPERYSGGEGVIRFHLTDDARRIPVRIESSMPVGGRVVLSLQSGTGGCTPAPVSMARR